MKKIIYQIQILMILVWTTTHWWEDFKRDWKSCAAKPIAENPIERYYFNTNQ